MVHTDSIEGEDPHNEVAKKQKSRRPANTAFKQQRLKAWQPILTPKTVLPLFFAVGIIFAPIGGLLLYASALVQELSIDYTDCNTTATSSFSLIPGDKVSSSFKSSNATTRAMWMSTEETVTPPYSAVSLKTSICTLQFSIPNDVKPPVLLYYRLSNFYQNHRRYVKSLDTDQLKGSAIGNGSIGSSACTPLQRNGSGFAYYPCGLIANSLFNDTIHSPVAVNAPGQQTTKPYKMTNDSISWSTDAELYKQTKYKHNQVAPPPNWALRYPNGYTADGPGGIPNLSTYEEFQVWMRTAALPSFSKLALQNDHDTLSQGIYELRIFDYFPVKEYGGTKSILISTRTIMGGKNSFMGIAYVIVGGICIVLGVVFTIAHLVKPRKLGDHTYLSWNNDANPTATATGRESRPGPQNA